MIVIGNEKDKWEQLIAKDGLALKDAPDWIKDDPEIVKIATKQNPDAFQFASDAIKQEVQEILQRTDLERFTEEFEERYQNFLGEIKEEEINDLTAFQEEFEPHYQSFLDELGLSGQNDLATFTEEFETRYQTFLNEEKEDEPEIGD
jgi:hypothetical protein